MSESYSDVKQRLTNFFANLDNVNTSKLAYPQHVNSFAEPVYDNAIDHTQQKHVEFANDNQYVNYTPSENENFNRFGDNENDIEQMQNNQPNFLQKYWMFLLAGLIALIIAGGVVVWFVHKKKKEKKELEARANQKKVDELLKLSQKEEQKTKQIEAPTTEIPPPQDRPVDITPSEPELTTAPTQNILSKTISQPKTPSIKKTSFDSVDVQNALAEASQKPSDQTSAKDFGPWGGMNSMYNNYPYPMQYPQYPYQQYPFPPPYMTPYGTQMSAPYSSNSDSSKSMFSTPVNPGWQQNMMHMPHNNHFMTPSRQPTPQTHVSKTVPAKPRGEKKRKKDTVHEKKLDKFIEFLTSYVNKSQRIIELINKK